MKRSTRVRVKPKAGSKTSLASIKRRALAVAHKIEEAAKTESSTVRANEAIARLQKEAAKEISAKPGVYTTRAAVASWLARKVHEVKPRTISFYRSSSTKFLLWLKRRAGCDINILTRGDVTAYRNHLAKNLQPGSVNHDLSTVRMLCKDAMFDGKLQANPTLNVKKVRLIRNKTQRRPFTREELDKVLAVASPEWRSMVMFGLYTGQRMGDVAKLKWGNIGATIIQLTTEKMDRAMKIPIAAPLKRHISRLKRKGNGPHPAVAGLTVSARSNQFAVILFKAGLRKQHPQGKSRNIGRDGKRACYELSYHCLRHTAVTMLYEAGVPEVMVKEIIGHTSSAMSQHYTHIGEAALSEAMAKMPDIAASKGRSKSPLPQIQNCIRQKPQLNSSAARRLASARSLAVYGTCASATFTL